MKKFLTYDLETCFLQKGQKRTNQRMLEIALYCKEFSFSKLINPCEKYNNGEEIIESLNSMDQNPEKSLRFWTKLLVEKRHLKSHFKRAGQEKQADAISILLQRSQKAMDNKGEYTTSQWLYALENNKEDVKLAKKYLDKYEVEETKGPLFYDCKSTLEEALKIGTGRTWIAHNGKSFDEKIVVGNCARDKIKCEVVFEDSLPMFRRTITSDSYSQPLLYRGIFGKGYKAHHALDDAIALYQLLEYVSDKESITIEKLFEVKKSPIKKYDSDLSTIRGVGQKSVEKFKKGGIHTKKDLYEWVQLHSHDEFLKQFRGVHRYKSLADKLYPI
jgi:hypothetical protein